jgi:hypothetical protein
VIHARQLKLPNITNSGRTAMKPILTALLLVLATPAIADPFDEAVSAWLNVDDKTALPALSALAKAGDENAMLLLGLIDQSRPRSDWLQSLDRKTVMDIMRAPGGLSGRNWLTEVEDLKSLAEALMYTGPDDDFAAKATVLLKADEWAGAIPHLMTAFNQEPSSLVAISEATPLPARLNHLLWFSAAFASNPSYGPAREATPAEIALLDQPLSPEWKGTLQSRVYLSMLPVDSQPADLTPSEQSINRILRKGEARSFSDDPGTSPDDLKAAALILDTALETAPLRVLCEAACPDAVSDCTRTLYSEIGGAFGIVQMHPPLVTLIPLDQYYASPRLLDDLRKMALRREARDIPAYAACGYALLHP